MKQYLLRENTPLAFHRFFWYFSLPIGFLLTIRTIYTTITEMTAYHWLYTVDIIYSIITLILFAACFIGFFGWKPYAWYCLITSLGLNVSYCVYSVIIYQIYLPDEIGEAVGRLLGIVIYTIIVGIYYTKRRPLFFNSSNLNDMYPNLKYIETEPKVEKRMDSIPEVKFCRKCGHEIIAGYSYCGNCGTPVIRGNKL